MRSPGPHLTQRSPSPLPGAPPKPPLVRTKTLAVILTTLAKGEAVSGLDLSDLRQSNLPFPYFACDSKDLPCLKDMSSKSTVLISLAGPYTLYGADVGEKQSRRSATTVNANQLRL